MTSTLAARHALVKAAQRQTGIEQESGMTLDNEDRRMLVDLEPPMPPPQATFEFRNELGNRIKVVVSRLAPEPVLTLCGRMAMGNPRIRIEVIGPTSTSDNTLTWVEAQMVARGIAKVSPQGPSPFAPREGSNT